MSRKAGIILSVILGIIVGLWLWAAIIPKDSTQIGGSTSVDPVMQRLTNTYRDDFNGDSFIYSSAGSTGGVNNAKSGTYKIGFISRALDDSADYVTSTSSLEVPNDINSTNSSYKKFGTDIYNYFKDKDHKYKYTGNQMHYVQVATDAIIVTYNAPDWFKNNFSDKFNIEMTGDKVNSEWQKLMQHIYTGKYTWDNVANDIANITKDDSLKSKIVSDNSTIVPFAREPGSGTRNSFDHEFGFDQKGVDDLVKTAPTVYNSNGMMYNDFTENTFGYMSMNYLAQIQNNNNLETAYVNGINPHDSSKFALKNVGVDYKLTRPYIGLIKWNLPDNELKKISNFLAWISTATQNPGDKNEAYQQYLKSGLKPEFKLDDPKNIPGAEGNIKTKVGIDDTRISVSTNDALVNAINQGYLSRH